MSQNISEALDLFHRRIASAGLKSTRQRDIIVASFFEIDRHISVQELHDAVKEQNPGVGYATVYRTLKVLVETDLAHTRDFGDGITRFDPMFDQREHDHLICTDCREVFEFKDVLLDVRQKEVAASLGSFVVQRRNLEIYASCSDPNCPRRPK